MKTKTLFLIVCLMAFQFVNAQLVEIEADATPNSELVINTTSIPAYTVNVESDYNDNGSVAIYAKAYNVTGFGDITTAIVGDCNIGNNANFATGIFGTALRASPSGDGRSYGVRGRASDSTPGANYGVFGELLGTNGGTAVFGHDQILHGGWNQVLPSSLTYAGYFRGKGYFHDNLGIGEDDPQEKIHVDGGNIYVAGSLHGVILSSPTAGCFLIQVDDTGALVTTAVTCP